MRLSVFLLFILAFQVLAKTSYSQNTKLTLNLNQVTVSQVLSEIEDNSEFYFLYNNKLIDVNQIINIDVKKKTIEDILTDLFADADVDFMVKDRQIVLTTNEMIESFSDENQQQIHITGNVTDEDGNTIPGVNITIKGTSTGTITDVDGNFEIDVPDGNATLVFSFVGMKSLEVPLAGRTILNISMENEIISVEEVVIVGYGVQKKINVTGAVAAVSAEELADRPVTNVSEALQGLVPGLQITTTDGGKPGSDLSWQIRGVGSIGGANDSPLILIDGIPSDPNTLNPEDIESVSVLKDAASAAIYGSRAPYGVVIITTKKGKQEQMKVTFNSNLSWRFPTESLNPLGSMDFMEMVNEGYVNNGLAPRFDQAWIDSVQYHVDHPELDIADFQQPFSEGEYWYRAQGVDIDWWHEVYKKVALMQNYNLGAQGGSKTVTYYASLGYQHQDGLFRLGEDYYKRYNGLFNVHATATKWLDFDLRFRLSRENKDAPNTSQQRSSYRFWPIASPWTPNGDWHYSANELQTADEGGRKNTMKDLFNSTLAFVIKPFEGLKIKGDVTFNSFDSKYTQNSIILYHLHPDGTNRGAISGSNTSYVRKSYSMNKFYTANFYADYEKRIADHNLHALVGYQREYNNYESLKGYRDELISPEILSLSTATGTNIQATDNAYEWSSEGYFGRLNYNYKEKYLFEFNARYDGSSRFPRDLRWGFFPSASVGYNIARESFFEPLIPVINYMKIRASYGRLGNSNVYYYYVPTISKYQTNYIGPDGTYLDYVSAPGLGNYGITWEKPTTFNIGLDAGMFKNQLEFNIDWYRRNTIDMVGPSEPLPSVLGVSVPNSNNTEMRGQGFEIALSYRGGKRDFHYQAMLNVSHHKETVTKYYNPKGLIHTYYNGKVLGEIWGFETAGLIDEETINTMADQSQIGTDWALGDVLYKDQNGDGKIDVGASTLDDHGDLIRIGNTTPDYEYNFILSCDYKGFDFRVFFNGMGHTDWWPGSGQGDMQQMTSAVFFGNSNNVYNHAWLEEHLDRWTPETPDGYYPRNRIGPAAYGSKNKRTQSRYLQNRAFIRMKNIQFGYTFPSKWTKPILIHDARIYVSGENLLTFTNLMIFDPETPGLIYPLQKVFSAGIKLSF